MLNRDNFLKQPKQIQNIIKKYWYPNKFNTFFLKESDKFIYCINMVNGDMINTTIYNNEVWYNIYDENIIPSLSSFQVELIIERITKTKVFSMINRTGIPIVRLFGITDGTINIKEIYYGEQSCDNYKQKINKINLLWEVLVDVIKKEEI